MGLMKGDTQSRTIDSYLAFNLARENGFDRINIDLIQTDQLFIYSTQVFTWNWNDCSF